MLEKGDSFSGLSAKDIMSSDPRIITVNSLAYDALRIMEDNNISQIIVVDNDMYVGIVHIHEILKEGIL